MDSRLLITSFLLLCLELAVLLGDLGILPWNPFPQENISFQKQAIGKLTESQNLVRRKQQESFIWQDTDQESLLYSFDSILTLDDSAAKIELEGGIQLQLYENTLIVINTQEEKGEDVIRLKYAKGNLLSNLKNKELQLSSENWNFKAYKNSSISFRSLEDGKMEIEVSKGQLEVYNKTSSQERTEVKQGENLELSESKILQKNQITDNFSWKNSTPVKLYTHNQRILVPFQWNGSAEFLEITDKNQKEYQFPLQSSEYTRNLPLPVGHYYARLRKGKEISPSLPVTVLEAPETKYIFPLPRDRVFGNNKQLFSWTPIRVAQNYALQVSKSLDFSENSTEIFQSKIPATEVHLAQRGPLYWRVVAYDEDGVPIHAPYVFRIYSLEEALPAPTLREIKKERLPANSPTPKKRVTPSKPVSSLIQKIWDEIKISSAYAQQEPPQKKFQRYRFQWEKVEGADFYLIEISKSSDFLNPLVMEESNSPEFVWESSESEIVYWRVAAGSKDGKMGLFSEPRAENLKNIVAPPSVNSSPVKDSKIALPIEHKSKKSPVAKTKSLNASQNEVAKAPKSEKPDPTQTKDSKNVSIELPPTLPLETPKTRYQWQSALGLLISYNQRVGFLLNEKAKYSFDGTSILDLRYDLSWAPENRPQKKQLLRTKFKYQRWKAKNTNQLVYQEKLTDLNAQVHYLFPWKTNWRLGLSAYKVSSIARDSFESAKIQSEQAFGLSVEHVQYPKNRYENTFFLSYAQSTKIKMAHLKTKFLYLWLENQDYKVSSIAEIDLMFYSDKEKSYNRDLGTSLGIQFEWK